MTGRVVDFASASSRQERAEANKKRLLDEGRERTDAARAAAADTVPPSQRRGEARYERRAKAAVDAAHDAIRRQFSYVSGTAGETARIEAVGRIAAALILADREAP